MSRINKARKKHLDALRKLTGQDYYVEQIKKNIIQLLEKESTNMTVKDIAGFLKHQKVDEIKEFSEELYYDGKIKRTQNYRYFIEKVPQKNELTKKVNIKSELKKYKEMLDDGLIEQEDYDAKKKELLGI